MISILLPTWNDDCVELVRTLQKQAASIDGLQYEIIVADDGSMDREVVERNRQIGDIPHCRMIERKENVGRSAIRNFLCKEAQGEWLLFIDSDMSIALPDFLQRYLKEITANGDNKNIVIYGGYVTSSAPMQNLRYRYEIQGTQNSRAEERKQHPYLNFHTSNFLISKETMLQHPLNEELRHYGYEDVLFGKELAQNGILIRHIDAPVVFSRFESNQQFIEKTEEALHTLNEFRDSLHGYSRLLDLAEQLKKWHLDKTVDKIFGLRGKAWRRQLIEKEPPLRLFQIYKLGYFIHISQHPTTPSSHTTTLSSHAKDC